MALAINDRFLLDAYTGGGGFLDGRYLVRHPRESDEKFGRRRTLAVYPNYVRKIVDTYLGFLWRRPPKREGSELYAQFQQNADGRGGDLNSVLISAQRLALLLGVVFLIVDREPLQARNRSEEPLPYLAIRLPGEVVRYRLGARGELEEITFQELNGERLLWRTFTREGWRLEERGRIIESGSYRLGRPPVVPLYASPPLEPNQLLSASPIRDIALLNWDLFNLYSELRELFRAQVFSILALPVASPEERERLRDLTVSTENAVLYDPSGGGKPDFIAPPEGPVKLYMEQISSVIEQIYKLASLEFVGGVQKTGVALSFHFQQTNAQLVQLADLCELAEKQLAELVHAWMGEPFSGYIAYPRDFNLHDLQQELQLALDAVTLQMGPAFERALKKRLARQILGDDVSPLEMEEVVREIEAGGDEYGDRIRRRVNSRA